ncbi:hypothetical protein V1272_004883 [Bradyrhizobium sp. AZCC 1708]
MIASPDTPPIPEFHTRDRRSLAFTVFSARHLPLARATSFDVKAGRTIRRATSAPDFFSGKGPCAH